MSQLTSISADQVNAFAKRAFRAENAVLTLTGNVDASSIAAVTDGSGSGSMDRRTIRRLPRRPGLDHEHRFGRRRRLGMGRAAITDQKAATALDFIADYLFREETGVVAARSRSVAERRARHRSVHHAARSGRYARDDRRRSRKASRAERARALTALQQPMDRQTFDAAREAFLYHVAADTQTPQAARRQSRLV